MIFYSYNLILSIHGFLITAIATKSTLWVTWKLSRDIFMVYSHLIWMVSILSDVSLREMELVYNFSIVSMLKKIGSLQLWQTHQYQLSYFFAFFLFSEQHKFHHAPIIYLKNLLEILRIKSGFSWIIFICFFKLILSF